MVGGCPLCSRFPNLLSFIYYENHCIVDVLVYSLSSFSPFGFRRSLSNRETVEVVSPLFIGCL